MKLYIIRIEPQIGLETMIDNDHKHMFIWE